MSGTSRPVWLFRFLQKLKYQCLYWSNTNYNRKLCPGFDPDMCRIRKEWVLESRFVYFRFRVSWDFLKNWVPWGPQFLKNWVPFGSLNGTFKGPMSIWEHCMYIHVLWGCDPFQSEDVATPQKRASIPLGPSDADSLLSFLWWLPTNMVYKLGEHFLCYFTTALI